MVSVAAFFRPCQSHEWEIGATKWPWLCDNGVGELGLHRELANSVLSQFGEI